MVGSRDALTRAVTYETVSVHAETLSGACVPIVYSHRTVHERQPSPPGCLPFVLYDGRAPGLSAAVDSKSELTNSTIDVCNAPPVPRRRLMAPW